MTTVAIGLRLPRAFRCYRILSAVAVTASRFQRFGVHHVAVESAAAALAAGDLPPSFAVVAAAAAALAAAVPLTDRVLVALLFVRVDSETPRRS